MEAEYARSVKQSILDYVLLDPAEQRRLGLHMPLPVSLDIFMLSLGYLHRVAFGGFDFNLQMHIIRNTPSIVCGHVSRQCQVSHGSTYLLTFQRSFAASH